MKRFILIWGCVFAFLIPPSVTLASHIIGGIITYEFVSRNGNTATYKFKLTYYKDCASNNGSGGNSPLPNTIRYNVFLNNVKLYNVAPSVTMTNQGVTNVAPPSYPCLTIPPYVCVQKGEYEWTVALRDTNASYFISTSICCRNDRISNIFSNANSTGASYFAEISPAAQRANNSSPVFSAFPPTVICVGEPLRFDHSATDADGDSLTYEFCYSNNVRNVAGNCTGSNTNQCAPPFESVQYRAPQYSATNPMGGNPRVVINPISGLITGTPTVQGNYVVGVCVKEYRNGVYMGSIFRDFQFNAEICRREVVASVSADSLGGSRFFLKSCDDTTVTIFNTSTQRANIFSTRWEIYIRDSTHVFNTWDARVAFPDTGTYRARLLLNPSTACGDSAELTIRVGSQGLSPKFDFKYDTCVAGPVSFRNQSVTNPMFPVAKYLWDLGDNTLDSTTWATIDHQFAVAGSKRVNLKLWDRLGCTRDTSVSFDWLPAPPIIIVEPSNYKGCVPGRISFKNRSHPVDSTYDVRWTFGDGSTLRGVDAQHVYEQAGVFTITLEITSPIGCKKSAVFRDFIQVLPNPKANFDFMPKEPTNLLPQVNFIDSSSADVVARRWFFGGTYGISTEKNPQVIYGRDTGWVNVKLLVNNQYGCADTITKRIYVKPEVTFFMPNAFSPNHDATNEEFKGVGFTYGLKKFRMAIWSRWGELLYETTDPNQGWNGTKFNGGVVLPQGVYLYEVDYVAPTGERVSKRAYFTLFR